MKKFLKILKNNRKTFVYFIVGILLASSTVYGATILYQSNQIGYDNTNSGFKDSNNNNITDVYTALEELYTLANSSSSSDCEEGYTKQNNNTYDYKCVSNSVFEVKNITLQLGDLVEMEPTLSSFTTDTNMTGYSSTQTIYPKRLHLWRVIRVNNNGTYDAVSEYVSDTMVYFGQSGTTTAANTATTNAYKNIVGYLNVLASKYENSDFTVGSRIMGYNGQTEYLNDTSYFDGTSTKAGTSWTSSTSSSTTSADEALGRGDVLYATDTNLVSAQYNNSLKAYAVDSSGNPTTTVPDYWVGSRYYYYDRSNSFAFRGKCVMFKMSPTGDIVDSGDLRSYYSSWNNNSEANALRPIITLKSSLQATGVGTSDYPYVLVN